MLNYSAPLHEYRFLLDEVLQWQRELPQLPDYSHIDGALIASMLDAGAGFASQLLLPLNASGDQAGCTLSDGAVSAPPGFAQAYRRFRDDGWPALTVPAASGGQGFPAAAGVLFDEILASTNVSFSIFATVREGVLRCIEQFGSAAVRARFSARLASGDWLATMCLTEAQAGSDMGLIRASAEPLSEGLYALSGSKIFISNGDHELTPNIVHLVLARTAGAPKGSKGLSLFAVPKYRLDERGDPAGRNGVTVSGLEHKHGIRANASCALVFERSQAYLIGELNHGLPYMFVLMNAARLAVGAQAIGLAEVAHQNARQYVGERLQGRALTGPARPELAADPLLAHIGIKAVLVKQKLFIEAGRLLLAWIGMLTDQAGCHTDPGVRQSSAQLVELLTPVAKAYLSRHAIDHISSAMNLYGGHGYIRDTGIEQLLRDAAIGPIYEGTNYIQALDLLGRKTLADQGQRLKTLCRAMRELAGRLDSRPALHDLAAPLASHAARLDSLAERVMVDAVFDRDVVGLVAPAFLELVGTVVFAHLWAWMAEAAERSGKAQAFYQDKITLAGLYMEQAQAEIDGLLATIGASAATLERIGRLQSLRGAGVAQ